MAGESRHERPVRRGRVDDTGGDVEGGQKLYYHLTLLAETVEGYRNLMKLSSAAYLEGYYYKPRLDWELLERHHEGLIATTGCLGGVVLQALLAGDYEGAEQRAARLQDIFGQGNLFVELQDHGIADQHRTNPQLIEIAQRIGAPLLATNDSHYTHREDAVAHDALLCVQTGALLSDTNRFKFEGTEHYLKSASEMRHLFREVPEACDNTLLIAERADVQIELGKPSLPEFPVPDRFTGATYEERAQAYLKHLAFEGAKERYGDPMPPEVVERLEFELNVIGDMGFPAYFLVVWDLIRFARESGIRVGPGRGSAAGCCVAYCLRIVDLDPIRYDLLFERFLNPGRKQMPDIDMDFDERYRADVMRYAAEKYGSDRVAQIITFSTIKARAAVRDASRVLGKPYIVGDKIAKAMPPLIMGRDTPLRACLDKIEGFEDGYASAGDLRAMHDTDPEAKEVIDVALGLEGLRRQDGIHAAAVVISRDPLTDYLPIQRKPDSGGSPEDAPIVTQYEMHGVEELGLLKMDFLGLRNLSVIERALDLIEADTGERPDIDNLDLADEPTLEMLRRAESVGVFQLEGAAMRQTLRALAPTSFDDVAALVALYRPGPMAANMHRDYPELKNGRKELTYLHPDIEPILKDTYGLMLYQESVMRVAQRFAGYSLEEADNLRKACGKKIRALIAAEREKFVAGCVSEGYGEELGTQLFDIIEPFADYAFNKSHSYGYGLVAYQTAWLKAHYPVEYMSALLTSVKDNKDKTAVYLAECRNMGIEVLVPDVNRSVSEFAPDRTAPEADAPACLTADESGESGQPGVPGQPGEEVGHVTEAEAGQTIDDETATAASAPPARRAIVFGLAAVRNVGESLVERIVAERQASGPFEDIFDFCSRVDPIGAQQADDGVARQGGRLRLPRPSAPGTVPGPRGRGRPDARAPQGAGFRHHDALRRPRGGGIRSGLGRGEGGHPRQRIREGSATCLREGDARPLRQRPPAHGLRGRPGPPHRLHARGHARGGSCGRRPGAGAVCGGRGHRPQAVLHEEGRSHGPVHPGRPPGRHGGLRLPEDDGRVRGAHRERRHRRDQGSARHQGGGAEDRLHGGRRGPCSTGASPISTSSSPWACSPTAGSRASRMCCAGTRGRLRSCCTWGRRCSVCRPNSTSTARTDWWGS